jgi:peptidoglycan/xylan/chitin deacetylase (PgdA/CDA1 family)
MKRAVKRILQKTIALSAPAVWRRQGGSRLLILMYHRVLPADHEDRATEEPGMYVSPQSLQMHLQLLPKYFEPVFLDDWVERAASGASLPRLACAVTFDDGWRDNYEHAFPVIRSAAMPAHIFIVADYIGTATSVWTARLARLLVYRSERPDVGSAEVVASILRRAGLSDEVIAASPTKPLIAQAISQCKSRNSDYAMNDLLQEAETALGLSAAAGRRDFMDWNEVREMASSGFVRFGSHTRRHTRLLPALDAAVLDDEVAQSRRSIEAAIGRPTSLFCYPNGDYSDAALHTVAQHYSAAVTTRRGWNVAGTNRFQLKRIGLHEDVSADPASYLSRLTGLL